MKGYKHLHRLCHTATGAHADRLRTLGRLYVHAKQTKHSTHIQVHRPGQQRSHKLLPGDHVTLVQHGHLMDQGSHLGHSMVGTGTSTPRQGWKPGWPVPASRWMQPPNGDGKSPAAACSARTSVRDLA